MSTLIRFVALAALVLFLPFCAACTGLQGATAGSCFDHSDKSGESSEGFPAPSKTTVWQSAMQAVKEQGYVPDPSLSSSLDGYVETRWKLSLQPFAGTGFRERVTIKVLPVKGRENYFRLETNAMRQMNHNMTQPSSAIAAEWAAGSRNPGMERLLNNQIEMMFVPSDVSPEFRMREGMPEEEEIRDYGVKPVKQDSWMDKLEKQVRGEG
jgi:hypothetical protein